MVGLGSLDVQRQSRPSRAVDANMNRTEFQAALNGEIPPPPPTSNVWYRPYYLGWLAGEADLGMATYFVISLPDYRRPTAVYVDEKLYKEGRGRYTYLVGISTSSSPVVPPKKAAPEKLTLPLGRYVRK